MRDLRHLFIVHTTTVYSAWRWLTRPKQFSDDKLLIKFCLDLFFISFINGTGNVSSYNISTPPPPPPLQQMFEISLQYSLQAVTSTSCLWCYCTYSLFKFITIEYKVNLEENRPPGRSMSKWEDNIHMDLQELGAGVEGFIQLKIRTSGALFWTR